MQYIILSLKSTADAQRDTNFVVSLDHCFSCQDSLCSFSPFTKVLARNKDCKNGSVCSTYISSPSERYVLSLGRRSLYNIYGVTHTKSPIVWSSSYVRPFRTEVGIFFCHLAMVPSRRIAQTACTGNFGADDRQANCFTPCAG